jgi:NAD(P)-dependent dehydrogenase (short-subunit alcohol dehydrogenase family)
MSQAAGGPSPTLVGRTALVTGASRGIGRTIALTFAAHGARVALAARSVSALEEVAAECGPDALVVELDVTDEAACREAVRRCEDTFGGLDILVNNAGIAESRPFLRADTAFWRRVMAVDVEGPMWLTQAALPSMMERQSGAVIAIASIAAKMGFAYVTAYTAAKHALLGLTRSLAVEHATSGVTFNCVCPYFVDTPMTQATIDNIAAKTGRTVEEAHAELLSPQGRLILPQEVAAVCLLLASPEGCSITGQAINVDGGACQA